MLLIFFHTIQQWKLTRIICLSEFPNFAEQALQKKPTCQNCKELCSFSLERILHPTNPLTQTDVNEELEIHHHPKSRILEVNGVKHTRLTGEAAQELA